jgi:rfaE bifunctional protein nucleotidyltransferase chain/domain
MFFIFIKNKTYRAAINMSHLKKIQTKIFSNFTQLKEPLQVWKDNGETIVFTNGCFDVVHRGHIEFLIKAADKGTKLILGLNTDKSVTLLKGKSRPLVDQESRAILLASLYFVDAVILFPEETPYKLISQVLPDYLLKGSDYSIEEIAGFDVVLNCGGKVETIDLVPGFSSSSLIKKLKNFGDG